MQHFHTATSDKIVLLCNTFTLQRMKDSIIMQPFHTAKLDKIVLLTLMWKHRCTWKCPQTPHPIIRVVMRILHTNQQIRMISCQHLGEVTRSSPLVMRGLIKCVRSASWGVLRPVFMEENVLNNGFISDSLQLFSVQ